MNVLLTSVGRRSYMIKYFKEVFKNSNIIATNSSKYSTALFLADKFYISPLIYENTYIDFLLDICKKENIKILISLFDIDLLILAKNKQRFLDIGVFPILSDENIISICNDKFKMYEFLKENSFDTVFTSLNKNDLYIEDLLNNNKLLLKPRFGMGSLAMYTVSKKQELDILYNKVIDEITSSYLKYEAKAHMNNAVIIQKKLEGKEYGIDIINDLQGNFVKAVVKEKIAMRAGETDIARVINNTELEYLAKKLALLTKHIGNMDVDVIVNKEGMFIIDMNARFGGGYPFTHNAGINIIEAFYKWLNKLEFEDDFFDIKYYDFLAKNIEICRLDF